MVNEHKKAEMEGRHDEEPLSKENPGRFAFFPIKEPAEKIPKPSAAGNKCDNSGVISEKPSSEQNVNQNEAASCTKSKDFSDLYDLRIQELKDIGAPSSLIRNAQKMFYGSKGISTNDHYPIKKRKLSDDDSH